MDEVEEREMLHNEYKRSYLLHVPENYSAEKKYPLIFVLHGITSRAKAIAAFSGFNDLADEKDFIVCYPQGVGRSWGVDIPVGKAGRKNIDDISFLDTLVSEISSGYSVARDSVFSCGISNGGFMTMKYACNRPGEFAGIALVCSNMFQPTEKYCANASETPLLLMGAADDPFLNYYGSNGTEKFPTTGYPGAVDFWIKENNCSAACDSLRVDNLPDDKTSVTKRVYCGHDRVVLYEIEGGGHGWPGRDKVFKEHIFGRVTREVDASVEIVKFFLGR
jgi:polyhydroxybutyrate depolymerase